MQRFTATLISEFVAGVLLVLFGAYCYDRAASWLGWKATALCTVLSPVMLFASSLGVLVITLGVIVWAISLFRRDADPP